MRGSSDHETQGTLLIRKGRQESHLTSFRGKEVLWLVNHSPALDSLSTRLGSHFSTRGVLEKLPPFSTLLIPFLLLTALMVVLQLSPSHRIVPISQCSRTREASAFAARQRGTPIASPSSDAVPNAARRREREATGHALSWLPVAELTARLEENWRTRK